jgi:hypothetical protein
MDSVGYGDAGQVVHPLAHLAAYQSMRTHNPTGPDGAFVHAANGIQPVAVSTTAATG